MQPALYWNEQQATHLRTSMKPADADDLVKIVMKSMWTAMITKFNLEELRHSEGMERRGEEKNV